MADSILDSVKSGLGVPVADTSFDSELMLHINSVFSTLNQLGVGPVEGFSISDNALPWTDFLGSEKRLNAVKSYMVLRVKMLFDPPTTSFALDAFKERIKEEEWRITNAQEDISIPDVTPTV